MKEVFSKFRKGLRISNVNPWGREGSPIWCEILTGKGGKDHVNFSKGYLV